jgi:FtsP/CotA-like multicopper oxidase with cupredoxin domain
MDGVGGVTQPHIKSGQTFVYEFEMRKSGSFMYHPHSDEMVQMAMGMMGMFVVQLRKIISDETLLRYNAMLIDVFALLAEARQRI